MIVALTLFLGDIVRRRCVSSFPVSHDHGDVMHPRARAVRCGAVRAARRRRRETASTYRGERRRTAEGDGEVGGSKERVKVTLGGISSEDRRKIGGKSASGTREEALGARGCSTTGRLNRRADPGPARTIRSPSDSPLRELGVARPCSSSSTRFSPCPRVVSRVVSRVIRLPAALAAQSHPSSHPRSRPVATG